MLSARELVTGRRLSRQCIALTILLTSLACFAQSGVDGMRGSATAAQRAASHNDRDNAPALTPGQTATQLQDGSWIVVGGKTNPTTFEIYKKGLTSSSNVGVRLAYPRSYHTATTLADGSILIFGGRDSYGNVLDVAEKYDPSTNTIETISEPGLAARAAHSATVLMDGRVLLAGGVDENNVPKLEPELYDPSTSEVEHLQKPLDRPRLQHAAVFSTKDTVVLEGGIDESGQPIIVPSAYDASSQTFRPGVSASGGVDGTDRTIEIPAVIDSRPRAGEVAATVPQFIVVQFNTRMATASLNGTSATLFGPHGPVDVTTIVAEGGRLLFLKPAQELFPGSHYTILIDGASDDRGLALPFTAIEFGTPKLEARVEHAVGGTRVGSTQNRGRQRQAETSSVENSPSPSSRQGLSGSERVGEIVDTESPTTSLRLIPVENVAALQDPDEAWVPNSRHFRGNWTSGRKKLKSLTRPKNARLDRTLHGHPEIRAVMHSITPATATPEMLSALVPAAYRQPERGSTSVIGQVLKLNGRPLPGVSVSIGSQQARTDANGEFRILNPSSGHQVMVIDGTRPGRNPLQYGRYEYGFEIIANQTNILPFVIWMVPLDSTHTTSIPSPTIQPTVVATPEIPGLELRLPAGTVIRDADGRIVTRLSITPIPTDQPPFPIPNFPVPVYFTIQPGGAHIENVRAGANPGAQLIYPNFTNSRPGTRMNFWNYDPRGRGWFVYGQGTVSGDGQSVIPDDGVVIHEFSGAMVSLPENAPAEGPKRCRNGDPVDCFTGLFINDSVDLVIDDVIPIEIRRTYRNRDHASRGFGIGTNLSYDSFNVGTSHGTASSNGTYTYQELILPDGERIFFPRISPGTDYYDAVYKNTSSPGKYFGATIHWSADEPGNDDGDWTLTLRDGTKYFFLDSDSSPIARSAAVVAIKDRNGNKVTLTRDANYNLVSVVSPSGRVIDLSYDSSDRVTSITDDRGRTISYSYDALGRLVEVTDQSGGVERFTYDNNDNMLTVTDKRDHLKVTNVYDTNDRVATQTYADGTTSGFDYLLDSNGKVTQTDFTDQRGAITRIQFNEQGYPSTTTFALGMPEQQTFSVTRDNSTNLIASVTDPLERVTSYAYDALGNLTEVKQLTGTPQETVTTVTYSTLGRPVDITDPNGLVTHFNYNSMGDLLEIVDPLNHTTAFTSDTQGRLLTVTDAEDVVVATFTHSGAGFTTVTDALGHTGSRFEDGYGGVVVTDPTGARTTLSFDALDRLTGQDEGDGSSVSFEYDQNGNVTGHTDANNNTTSYVLDSMNRVTQRLDAMGNDDTYSYEPGGKLLEHWDRKGQRTRFEYDALGRVIHRRYGATVANPNTYTRTRSYTWDDGDRLTQMLDSVSGSMTFTYDEWDRLTSETTAQGVVSYTYDAGGRRTSMTVQGEPAVSYSWDDASRLTQIQQSEGPSNGNVQQTVSFVYDDADRRTQTTLPNGITANYAYDDASRLTGIEFVGPSSSTIGDLIYTYDAAGRMRSVGGSLASVELPTPMSGAQYNANNQLTAVNGSTFSYDANGNLIADGVNTYSWNAENHLTGITGTSMASFEYDALGRRIAATIDGASSSYLYDGWNFIQEKSGVGTGAVVRANLLAGSVDEIFARMTSAGVFSMLTDVLGSILAETDSSAMALARYTYEPYGVTARSGLVSGNAQQYTGRENDGTGLYYYRARYYSPSYGRFISEDPLGWNSGQPNNYAYAGENPLSFVDPYGLDNHHVFPQQHWRGSDYSRAAQRTFDQSTIKTAGRHGWSRAHQAYNEATKQVAEDYCAKNGVNRANMTEAQARELVEEIQNSRDPRIKDFLDREVGPPRPEVDRSTRIPWGATRFVVGWTAFWHSEPAY